MQSQQLLLVPNSYASVGGVGGVPDGAAPVLAAGTGVLPLVVMNIEAFEVDSLNLTVGGVL
jgi:hypothetical protein